MGEAGRRGYILKVSALMLTGAPQLGQPFGESETAVKIKDCLDGHEYYFLDQFVNIKQKVDKYM